MTLLQFGDFPRTWYLLCLSDRIYIFSSVTFYSFIHKHSVIKFATLTLNASDHIMKGPNTFLLFSKYVPFYSLVKRVRMSLNRKQGELREKLSTWMKNSEPLFYTSCQIKFQMEQRFSVLRNKSIKLDFKICPIILINWVWKGLIIINN